MLTTPSPELVLPELQEIVRVAQYVAQGGSAAIHLIDHQWQHRIAAAGAGLGRTPRADSMCRLVVDRDTRIYHPDATLAPEFAGNPFTTADPPVRLYASSPMRESTGRPIGSLCVFDTTARPLDEVQLDRLADLTRLAARLIDTTGLVQKLARDALHDPLTGLANRTLLSERLALALARRRRHGITPMVAVLDLDGFKAVNDTHGHAAGDRLLVELGSRLSARVREEDTVARLGGDEFVVVLDQVPPGIGGDEVTGRLQSAFDDPFDLGDGVIVSLQGSIGLAAPDPGELSYEVLGRADLLMYEAKRARAAIPTRVAQPRGSAETSSAESDRARRTS